MDPAIESRQLVCPGPNKRAVDVLFGLHWHEGLGTCVVFGSLRSLPWYIHASSCGSLHVEHQVEWCFTVMQWLGMAPARGPWRCFYHIEGCADGHADCKIVSDIQRCGDSDVLFNVSVCPEHRESPGSCAHDMAACLPAVQSYGHLIVPHHELQHLNRTSFTLISTANYIA